MATFRIIVGVISLAVFIGLMVLLYYAAMARGKDIKFPPNIPPCPDYFAANPNGSGCILPPGLGNRDIIIDTIRAKNPTLSQNLDRGDPLQIPSGNLCNFAQSQGLSWNGVTNVHPCIDA